MTRNGTTDYLCYIPFDFNDPTYLTLDNLVDDSGMGLVAEDIFKYAMNILVESTNLNDVLNEIDSNIFPEHVPNDSVNTCLSICITFISHLVSSLSQYKRYLYLLITNPIGIKLDKNASTLEITFSV